MREKILLYFVKYPEPGKVKTRLAKTVGTLEAARLYRDLAEANFKVLKSLTGCGIRVWVVFDPPGKEPGIRSWLPGADAYRPQQGGGLGERLSHAFDLAFESENACAAALGSDTQGLHAGVIEEAFGKLESLDAVLGPAEDGGYYLIGLSHQQPALFEGIPWSSGEVLKITSEKMKALRLSCRRLETLSDLDQGPPAAAAAG